MTKVFVEQRKGEDCVYSPLEEGIATLLADPVRTGNFYLYVPRFSFSEEELAANPNLRKLQGKEVPVRHPLDPSILFATNYGLTAMEYSTTTHIQSPDRKEGYVLVQLTDLITDNVRTSDGRLNTILDVNTQKMASYDRFRVDGTFEEVMAELRAAGYNFTAPKEGETNLEWYVRMQEIIQTERQGKVTEELVRRANDTVYRAAVARKPDLEYLRQKFSRTVKLL